MTKAIRIHQFGGPEQMVYEDVMVPAPGPGEVRLRQTAVGLNFIDIYHRTGLYPLELPSVIGMEAAGVVEEIGAGVTEVQTGDRVAYAGVPVGAYAQERVIPAHRLVVLPQAIADQQAAAMMLQGMTVRYLLRKVYPLAAGDTLLVHAAAGGVGLILCQWARALGATVIGTVSSEAKAELAQSHGCTYPVIYTREDFVQRVKELTDGEGVPVVYDSIGKDTFEGSLDCLRATGLMVSYGNASGPVPPFDAGILAQKGSLFLTRPTLMTYTAKRQDLLDSAQDLFDVVLAGQVKIEVKQRYELSAVATAHTDLAARQTTGSTVLLP
ncbi:MAG TPA: quinone oxidoreductase [Gammaproteobacteria bacterium]|nr:quinone oxidoreductase [Gammaproteobacteria bacterium]